MSAAAAKKGKGKGKGKGTGSTPAKPRAPKPAGTAPAKPAKPRTSKTVRDNRNLLTAQGQIAPGVLAGGAVPQGMELPAPPPIFEQTVKDKRWRAANHISERDEPVEAPAVDRAAEWVQRLPVETWDKVRRQPAAAVHWFHAEALYANDYNPNHVAPPEMELLKVSILEDGWTEPLVAKPSGEIVDGFHRWTLAMRDPDVRALTDGYVPVVFLTSPPASQRMSTIRHNRARGAHHVIKMAEIVRDLKDTYGLSDREIERRLGMEPEEIDRLYDRGGMVERGSKEGYSKGWVPQ